jgi:hypothetical protein
MSATTYVLIFFTCELPDDIKVLKQNSDNSYHVGKCLTFVRMRHEKTSYGLGCLVSKRDLFLLTQVSCPIRFYLITGRRKQLWVRRVLRREKNLSVCAWERKKLLQPCKIMIKYLSESITGYQKSLINSWWNKTSLWTTLWCEQRLLFLNRYVDDRCHILRRRFVLEQI